jgi:hypothetical protein
MSRDFVTFSPTRAAYSARVIVVFITWYSDIIRILLPILSSNFVLSPSVSWRPYPLLSPLLSHCESVFVARSQHTVSFLYETTACSNVTESVHVAPNYTKFLKGISFSYVVHSSVAIFMTHRRKNYYALWSTIQPMV